jgi:hypothetical protein
MSGTWTIPQPEGSRKKTTNDKDEKKWELLVLTIMDPDTNFLDMTAMPSKTSVLVARAFDALWLCRYPRPFECIHDAGGEFTGIEFQELLQSYGIKSRPITVNNPQANAILERAHQTIANQMRSLVLMSVDIQSLADMQQFIVDPVKWALNSTYHTTLEATPGQLAFGRDMIMPTSYLANWHYIRARRQAATDKNTINENKHRLLHNYSVGDKVLIIQDKIIGKLAKPTQGTFLITAVANQHINGTVTIRRRPNATEVLNIRRLRPFRAVEDADALIVE